MKAYVITGPQKRKPSARSARDIARDSADSVGTSAGVAGLVWIGSPPTNPHRKPANPPGLSCNSR